MHILLILAKEDKIRCPEVIDRVLYAEIPDATSGRPLHVIVAANNYT